MGAICDALGSVLPGTSVLCQAAGDAVSTVGSGILESIANACRDAETNALGTLMSFWTTMPSASVDDGSGPVGFLRANTSWLVAWTAVLGLLIGAGRMAWERKAEPARAAITGLINLVVVTGAFTAVIAAGEAAGDGYSTWILGKAMGTSTDFSAAATNLVSLGTQALTSILMIVLGLLGLLACLLQIVMMVARSAMLGLTAGLAPLSAAMSGTEAGRAWFRKVIGWGIAFLLYKPAAATIYAYCLVSMKQTDVADQLSGLVMLALAVLALPALLRFAVPLVASATGGGSGAGAALAGAAVATGARMLPSRTPANGSGGGAGATAASPQNGSSGGGSPTGAQSPGGPPRPQQAPPGAANGAAPGAGGGSVSSPAPGGAGTGTTAGSAGSGAGAGAVGTGTGSTGGAVSGAARAGAGSGGAAGGAASAAGPAGVAAAGAQIAAAAANTAKNAAASQVEGADGGGGPRGSG